MTQDARVAAEAMREAAAEIAEDYYDPLGSAGEIISSRIRALPLPDVTGGWRTMESAPRKQPFLAIRWDGTEWRVPQAFKWQASPPVHDKTVRFVSLDRQHWVREGISRNGTSEMDLWRWSEILPLPAPPVSDMKQEKV